MFAKPLEEQIIVRTLCPSVIIRLLRKYSCYTRETRGSFVLIRRCIGDFLLFLTLLYIDIPSILLLSSYKSL